jgi:hypothetical protein
VIVAPRLLTRDFINCGFLSKFVIFHGKYPKCQKNIKIYFINPIPGNPGPISRESGNETIVRIPGNREREIPGMKHYVGVWEKNLRQKHEKLLDGPASAVSAFCHFPDFNAKHSGCQNSGNGRRRR